MTSSRDGDPTDDELEALVADAMARRGDLIPTTATEVRRAEEDGVEIEGELPERLRELAPLPPSKSAPAPREGDTSSGALSQRVVSLDDIRRAKQPQRPPWLTHGVTFALGAAAAAATLLVTRATESPTVGQEPAGGPTATSAASAEPAPTRLEIPAVSRCQEACCAGSACAEAKGELRACATGRTCVACADLAGPTTAYRVRIGNLLPTKAIDPAALPALDVCARIAGSPWSCEPAHADASARPEGRTLPAVALAEDFAAGVELELRPRGQKQVLGRWRDSVRIGPNVLCRGVGVLMASEKEDLGSLSLFLEDAHFVEIARDASAAALKDLRGRFSFADVAPSMVETTAKGAERFALVVGPLDKATAERLRWALAERGTDARPTVGADHVGAPQRLP